jgi:hypothetical protein
LAANNECTIYDDRPKASGVSAHGPPQTSPNFGTYGTKCGGVSGRGAHCRKVGDGLPTVGPTRSIDKSLPAMGKIDDVWVPMRRFLPDIGPYEKAIRGSFGP